MEGLHVLLLLGNGRIWEHFVVRLLLLEEQTPGRRAGRYKHSISIDIKKENKTTFRSFLPGLSTAGIYVRNKAWDAAVV